MDRRRRQAKRDAIEQAQARQHAGGEEIVAAINAIAADQDDDADPLALVDGRDGSEEEDADPGEDADMAGSVPLPVPDSLL
ncbi:hypothetical protein [Croceicoccus estronivorus]|uniref:hypothetical protein n=1 Tax=Croceicoccus estronivorus TaxID=1172626 RepID=UPI000AD53869|nr:hypothetical protein [Croceicoccus estronivorus]